MAKVTGIIVVKVRYLCRLNTQPTVLETREHHEGESSGLFKKILKWEHRYIFFPQNLSYSCTSKHLYMVAKLSQ